MSDPRAEFLRRCAASGVPDELAAEMWEDEVEAEAERICARILRHAEAVARERRAVEPMAPVRLR